MSVRAASASVMLVDRDPLTREGLRAIMARHPELRVTGEANDLNEAITRMPTVRPDLIFVDACLAGENDGASIRDMVNSLHTGKIIVVGQGRREEEIFRVLDAGVSAYLIRGTIRDELVAAVRCAQAGGRYLPPEVQRAMSERARRPALTPRERGVLQLLAQARCNATIAAVLGISVGTVKLHVKAILAKLGVEGRAEAAVVALERGFSQLQ